MITLNYLAFQPIVWMILGAILLSLELLDGSFIVFLPTGLGAWLTAGFLQMQLQGALFDSVVFDDWSDLLLGFALASIAAIAMVQLLVRKKRFAKDGQSDDINQY